MNLRRIALGVGITAALVGSLALPAQATADDCTTPSWRVVNPYYLQGTHTLVVGLSATNRLVQVSTSTNPDTGGTCTADEFAIASSGIFRAEGELEASLTGQAPARVLVPSSDTEAGSHNVVATLRDSVGTTSSDHFADLVNVNVKRRTTFTSNQTYASPEPAAVGRDILVEARLKAASWRIGAYVNAGSKLVRLQSRPYAGGAYTTLATGYTTSGGLASFYTDQPAGGACYRIIYPGSPLLGATAPRGDCVAIP